MPEKLKVLVTGATGHQGSRLARKLLQRGHIVRALTRRPDSDAALELKDLGAQIVIGDMEDRKSLEHAARGMDVFWALSTPFEAGTEAETRQGLNMVDAAKTARVKHLVYASVADADLDTGIPHFDSKMRVEEHIQDLKLPYTIVAPTYFMENLFYPNNLSALQSGVLAMALPPDRLLQQIALEDVANFNLLVIENRDRFLGQRIDIASDTNTGPEMARLISEASGRTIQYHRVPLDQMRSINADLAAMWEWIANVGYQADLEGLHQTYPEIAWHSFEQWVMVQDWAALLEMPVEQ